MVAVVALANSVDERWEWFVRNSLRVRCAAVCVRRGGAAGARFTAGRDAATAVTTGALRWAAGWARTAGAWCLLGVVAPSTTTAPPPAIAAADAATAASLPADAVSAAA